MASCLMDLYPRYGLMGTYRGYIFLIKWW